MGLFIFTHWESCHRCFFLCRVAFLVRYPDYTRTCPNSYSLSPPLSVSLPASPLSSLSSLTLPGKKPFLVLHGLDYWMKTSSRPDDVKVEKRTWKYESVAKQECLYMITLCGDWSATILWPAIRLRRESTVLGSFHLVGSSFLVGY